MAGNELLSKSEKVINLKEKSWLIEIKRIPYLQKLWMKTNLV